MFVVQRSGIYARRGNNADALTITKKQIRAYQKNKEAPKGLFAPLTSGWISDGADVV
jgi:hypothetical protein